VTTPPPVGEILREMGGLAWRDREVGASCGPQGSAASSTEIQEGLEASEIHGHATGSVRGEGLG
jgi:hypothetical protein